MKLINDFLNQLRRPEGRLGTFAVRSMNVGHRGLTIKALKILEEEISINPETAADFGCGGGKAIESILRNFPKCHVYGYDYSTTSVEQARKLNSEAIKKGRCEIIESSVDNVNLKAGSLDLATAFETVYFWPGLEKCFSKIAEGLRAGGCFLIANELVERNETARRYENIIKGLTVYSEGEIEAALYRAGFSNVKSFRKEGQVFGIFIAYK